MSNITYGVVEEVYALGEASRTAYGIAAYADSEDDGCTTIIASVRDVCSDRRAMEELVQLCNRLDLSPIHLSDVIEDFLGL